MNHIIASIANEKQEVYGKLITSIEVAKKKTIEEIAIEKFKDLIGKTDTEIVEFFKLGNINPKIKNYYSKISNKILKSIFDVPKNRKIEEYVEEFEKAEIIIKTVRLKENNLPKEDISFPTFKYEELVEEEWDESNFKEILEHKFLFVFFQFVGSELVLRKVKFWNMPFQDIEKAKEVWLKTKEIVSNGDIVKEIKLEKRYTNFPNKKFNSVSHVRPHAKNALDTFPLPKQDKLTKLEAYTKQCFWINNTYIRDEIYLK